MPTTNMNHESSRRKPRPRLHVRRARWQVLLTAALLATAERRTHRANGPHSQALVAHLEALDDLELRDVAALVELGAGAVRSFSEGRGVVGLRRREQLVRALAHRMRFAELLAAGLSAVGRLPNHRDELRLEDGAGS